MTGNYLDNPLVLRCSLCDKTQAMPIGKWLGWDTEFDEDYNSSEICPDCQGSYVAKQCRELDLLISPYGIRICEQCDEKFTPPNNTNLCSVGCLRGLIRRMNDERV